MSRSSHHALLVAGIGSPHGDDQAGWAVVDCLVSRKNLASQQALCNSDLALRRIKVPHELIDHIDGIDELHLIDAARTSTNAGARRIRRFRFQVTDVPSKSRFVPISDTPVASSVLAAGQSAGSRGATDGTRSDSSHHIDLHSVLRLLAQLNRLPDQIQLWAIPAFSFAANEMISEQCRQYVLECSEAIARSISRR